MEDQETLAGKERKNAVGISHTGKIRVLDM
jgi:hypothetical protein